MATEKLSGEPVETLGGNPAVIKLRNYTPFTEYRSTLRIPTYIINVVVAKSSLKQQWDSKI